MLKNLGTFLMENLVNGKDHSAPGNVLLIKSKLFKCQATPSKIAQLTKPTDNSQLTSQCLNFHTPGSPR